jgi:VCBS repeat-containing protein
VNDAPVSADDSIAVAEGGTATVLVGGATNVLANDNDAETNPLTAVLVSGPAHGTLTLNANGTFSYTHNGSETKADSFTYRANDGTANGNIVTVNIGITPVNDAPVAINDTATTSEDTAVTVAVRGNDTDAENNSLIVSSITQGTNGSVVIDAVTGNPVYTPNAGFSGSDSFTYTISDGNGGNATATVNVTVSGNQAPVAVDDYFTTNEDTPIVISVSDLLGNDYDPEGTTLSLIGIPGLTNGTLSYNGTAITFYPNTNFNGIASFQYRISDGKTTDVATVHITVNPVDDPTTMAPETSAVAEDSFIIGNVLSNDSDPETPVLQVASYHVNGGTYTPGTSTLIAGVGTLLLNANGEYRFDPVPDYNGPVPVVSYTTNTGYSSTLTITVTPVNDAPVAVDDAYNTNQDSPVVINISDLLANDVDIDGNSLSLISIPGLTNGTLSYNGSTITFIPNPGFAGMASFQYRVSDGQANDVATVFINVNRAPETNAVTATGSEDTLVTIDLAGTDTDGTITGFVIKSLPANGVLYSDSLMTVTVAVGDLVSGPVYFRPDTNWNGSTSLTYAAKDNANFEDATPATVAITITPVADAAVLGTGVGAVKEDTPAQSSASGQLSISDPDLGQSAFQTQTNTAGAYGSFSLDAAGSWTYAIDNSKPAVQILKEGETRTETFTVTSVDGTTSSVVITVTGTNEAPVANSDMAASTAAGNVGLVSEYFGYSETAGSPNLSSIEQLYSFINGRVADATFIAKTFDYGVGSPFSSNLGNGTNLQTFLGSDAASLSSDPATTSDAIIRMRGFVELGAGTYNFKVTADDGYQIRVDGVVIAQTNQNQSASTVTHSQFTVAAEGLHSIEIIYWDQGGAARLKLELSDDAGATYDVLSSIPSYRNTVFSAVEDTALSLSAASLLANDTDVNGDTLAIQSVQGAVNGTVNLVAGNVIFTPAANYSGPASFTYTISDGKGGTDTATVNLSVAPVNDAPVAVANTVTATPNTALSIPLSTLLANDSDADRDALSLVSVQGAVNGTVSVSGTNLVFTPISNYEGAGSFTYTIRDPAGATSTATVNVNIGAAAAPSVVVVKSLLAIAHGTAGVSVKFPITTALVDTDGSESISVRISGVPTGATFNAGTNLGAGVWLVAESDLTNLMLNLPGSYTTGGTNLTVQVISTEVNGGMTASASATVRLEAAYTTIDKSTTISGNLTGTSASEYIVGGDGNNVITGGNGNDVIYGGNGNDTLSASSGSDIFFGGAGNDVINGSAGIDRINGGAGNDTVNGFLDNFVDVFTWSLGDQGVAGAPAVDTVQNFAKVAPNNNHNGGDVLDLRDLLIGEHVGANNAVGNLADYLHFEISGSDTIIHVSHTGGFSADSHTLGAGYTSSAETQKIVLGGVDLQSHYSGATTDQQIITQLLNNNKLITD